jgi:hypothetical protein
MNLAVNPHLPLPKARFTLYFYGRKPPIFQKAELFPDDKDRKEVLRGKLTRGPPELSQE